MGKVTLAEAEEVSQKLVSSLKPRRIILFGSVAKRGIGDDLDVLIIKDDDALSTRDRCREVAELLDEFYYRFPIDFFVTDTSHARAAFVQGNPFLRLIQREGLALYVKDSKMEWMHHAREELAMAEILYREKYYQGACFHAQQAAEKFIKGLLIDQGWELERTHTIRRLMACAEKYALNLPLSKDMEPPPKKKRSRCYRQFEN